jgi:hypothetical protein
MMITNIAAPNRNFNENDLPRTDGLAQERYGIERAKRLRDDDDSQFVDISILKIFELFLEDPWVDQWAVRNINTMFPEPSRELLIVDAG